MASAKSHSAPGAGARGGLVSVLGSNLEAIAIFRMTFGALLLVELVSRYQYLLPFYSDAGTLPLHLLRPKIDTLYSAVCVHCYGGSMLYLRVLLTVQVGLAMMFIVGYKTRLASIGSWFLYLSLSLRNTWLNFILDRYFHHLLFYSMFLPLDGTWAVDSRRRSSSSKATLVTPATIALKLLVVWIYWDAGYGKFSDPLQGWTLNAKPLPALDTYVRHTVGARYMYSLLGPEGLKLMTPTVPFAEMFSPAIALIASYFGQNGVLYGTIAMMCFMHVGIAVTMRNTVLLSLVACTAWAFFLPASVGADLGLTQISPTSKSPEKKHSTRRHKFSGGVICLFVLGSLWFETLSSHCNQSMKHIWSTLLHNRWNVFIGAEEYVTWEIAPGRLADGSIVDIWSKTDDVSWEMPGTGAPCTSTARAGRWRSYPYLAELKGEDGEVLWNYLCEQWDEENGVNPDNPDKKLLRFNFFMLQADVKPNMGFSATRKRLIHSHDCLSRSNFDINANSEAAQLPFKVDAKLTKDEL